MANSQGHNHKKGYSAICTVIGKSPSTYLFIREQVIRTEIHQIRNGTHPEFKRFWVLGNRLQPFLELCFKRWRVSIRKDRGNFLASTLSLYWSGSCFNLFSLFVALILAVFGSDACEEAFVLHLHFLRELRLCFVLFSFLRLSYFQSSTELRWFDVMCSPTLNEVFCQRNRGMTHQTIVYLSVVWTGVPFYTLNILIRRLSCVLKQEKSWF